MGRKTVSAMVVIGKAATRGLFRERDVRKSGVWHAALATAQFLGLVTPHGHGIWSHRHYVPTRYELLQLRFPKAVFWGPSALWLLGAQADEPEALWIAIANKARVPRTLDLSTVIVRTRKLDDDVLTLHPEGRLLSLRVHARERAQADVSRADLHRLLERAADRAQFAVPSKATFLSASLPAVRWHPIPAPRDEWVVEQRLSQSSSAPPPSPRPP